MGETTLLCTLLGIHNRKLGTVFGIHNRKLGKKEPGQNNPEKVKTRGPAKKAMKVSFVLEAHVVLWALVVLLMR